MVKRAKNRSKSITTPSARLTLFGQPQLLQSENAADYDELLARLCAAVKPVDVIDEMFIVDVASLEWEVLRWRRLKLGLIRGCAHEALVQFLTGQLEYDQYREQFADDLAEILKENLPEDQEDSAQMLAHKCARNEPNAVDKVNEVLDGIESDFFDPRRTMDSVLSDARAHKAQALMRQYRRREPDVVTLIDKLLAKAGVSMDGLVAHELEKNECLEYIERIDRLAAIAENRRNASLREIDRRRAVLGETLRRSVQEVEDAEFKVIETTQTKEKSAA